MKTLLLSIALFSSFGFRPKTEDIIQELQQSYQHVAWKNHGELGYDADTHTMLMMSYRIPVNHIAYFKSQHKQPMVEIHMDNKSTVTDVQKPNWSERVFLIPFKDKKSANEFIKTFHKLENI